jgi:CRP/FNR family transcriptional regulator, cyclic AMP receptor protein
MISNALLFSGLPEEDIRILETHCTTEAFKKGQTIIRRGEEASSLYIIKLGKVDVFIADENGKEIVLNTQGAGEYFGELALLGDTDRSASVVAVEDTECCLITREDFMEFLNTHPEINLSLIRGLVSRVIALSENLGNMALLDVYGRIAKLLIESAQDEDGQLITEEFTQQDIANRVGSSREMVNRIINTLKDGEYISYKGKRIVIMKNLPARW